MNKTTVSATSHKNFTLEGTWSGDQNQAIEKIEKFFRVEPGTVQLFDQSGNKAEDNTFEGTFFCFSKEEDVKEHGGS